MSQTTVLTSLQQETLAGAIRAREMGAWFRATRNGQRVTLASLFRRGLLVRRVWRGHGPNAAHEYRPSSNVMAEWNAKCAEARKQENTP